MELDFLEGTHSKFFVVLPERNAFGNKYCIFDCIEDAFDFREKMSMPNLKIYEEVTFMREVD